MTSAVPMSESDKDRLLREGARLLYTVAAGQFFELGDINAWFDRYNGVGGEGFESEHYGAIGERQSESDPVVTKAGELLDMLADRAVQARSDFTTAVEQAKQSGGSS